MYKILAGFIAGIIITSAVSVAIFSFTSVTGQGDNSGSLISQIGKVYSGAVVQPIAKAGSEIKDPDMASYYNDLVKGCALDQPPPDSEKTSLADMVPDIAKINQTAVTMPIIKARSVITDKNILQFYDELVKDIGF